MLHSLAVFRPAAEPVFIRLLRDLVADPDFHVATGVANVLFLDQ